MKLKSRYKFSLRNLPAALDKASGKTLDGFVAQHLKDHPPSGGQLNTSQVASTPGASILPHLRVVHVVSVSNSDAAAFAK
ncbi:hypothetical protein NL529_31950, partial [Klebsiella pneumoniae]|nr:hypothetical protein [Klebsiella pneumoniae]